MNRTEVAPGVSLASAVVGAGERDVVLLHGWMMASSSLSQLATRIASTDLRIALVDLRGAGDSDRPASDYGISTHVRDLATWIALSGLRRPVLVGHSMGGQIAQVLAGRHPELVSELILLNPVPATGLTLPDSVHRLFTSATSRRTQGEVLDMATLQLAAGARSALLEAASTVSAQAITEGLEAWTGGGFGAELAAIRAKTHVIATSDPFLPVELLRALVVDPISEATLHVIEGPGHYPHAEALEPTAALLRSLLGR